ITLAFVIPIIYGLTQKQTMMAVIFLTVAYAFIAHLFITTKYTVHNHTLIVSCSFLYKKVIDIHAIQKVIETNNPLSSAATSLDRLEIKFNKKQSILISPKFKKEFVTHIVAINPTIEVKWKTQKA
ncbi:MAG: PH domain-containing protein, partial [Chitinophagaceae bacterium]|nr:PH domain-containing protein [Chitinophagaceae bacterium]